MFWDVMGSIKVFSTHEKSALLMKSLYLLVDLFTLIIPLLFSFHPKIEFYKSWRYFFPANIIVAVMFITWDIFFTSKGIWSFNPDYITGIYFFNQPMEEVLFFICIPFSCVFTYYCLDKFYNLNWKPKAETNFCIIFSSALLLIGLIFLNNHYTSFTFISLGLISFALKFIAKVNWFGKVISVYIVLIIPFLIVNGILTGTGIKDAVVQYNNSEIIGLRLLTIPIEDLFYGLELFLLNVFFYKKFANQIQRNKICQAKPGAIILK
jgi:lycopene cyclase domain-containing protein